MKHVQVWMGHSHFSTTADIYSHVDLSSLTESATILGTKLSTAVHKENEKVLDEVLDERILEEKPPQKQNKNE